MATYNKASGVGGAWVDKAKVASGTKVKILSEATPSEEIFDGKPRTRNVVKIRLSGDEEPKNFDLNKPTINGLIDAFGEDSKGWIGHVLSAETMRTSVGGRMGWSMYLIPEGFELTTDQGNYIVIVPKGSVAAAPAAPAAAPAAHPLEAEFNQEAEEEINPEDIPF